jgi:hypothetical protein
MKNWHLSHFAKEFQEGAFHENILFQLDKRL